VWEAAQGGARGEERLDPEHGAGAALPGRTPTYGTRLSIPEWISNTLVPWGSARHKCVAAAGSGRALPEHPGAAGAQPRALPCACTPSPREEREQLPLLTHPEGSGCKGLTAAVFSPVQAHAEAN